MKIWKLKSDLNNYDMIEFCEEFSFEDVRDFETGKYTKTKPIKSKRAYTSPDLPLSDFPGGMVPIFSEYALETLSKYLEGSTRKIELEFSEKKYYGVSVLNELDVLDHDKSECIKFKSSGRVMKYVNFSFKICEELIANDIFRVVDDPQNFIFVSDLFKKQVEDNNLTGFIFELAWDSEEEE